MNLFKAFFTLALIILTGLLLSACHQQETKAPSPGQPSQQETTPNPVPAPQTTSVAVYYLKTTADDAYLVREVHQIEKMPKIAQAALNELIKSDPATPGAYRVLPSDTKVLGIKVDQGVATVNFSSEVLKANVGAAGEALGITSIVNTLTEFPAIQKVSFMVDGEVDKAIDWWGHIGLSAQPFNRDLTLVHEPAIWVTTPAPGKLIASPVEIRGSARVFEASVSFRIRDANGKIIATGFTTASEGAPGRGEFEEKLDFDPFQPGKGQIEVFSASPKDGSDMYKVSIPVKWKPVAALGEQLF